MARGTKKLQTAEKGMPFSVQDLAREVVVLLGHRSQPQIAVRVSVLDKLITQVLTRGLFDAERVSAMLRSQRLSDLEIVDHYIPAAARRLGQMWSEDIVGFAEVSIGTARLQSLAHQISSHWAMLSECEDSRDMRFLVTTPPGEDHTLGAVTLCTLLRKQGFCVDLRLGATAKAIVNDMQQNRQDGLMVSASRSETLESLSLLFKEIRQRVDHDPVLAVGGVVLKQNTDIKSATGADLATADLEQIIKLASSRRKGRISVVQ